MQFSGYTLQTLRHDEYEIEPFSSFFLVKKKNKLISTIQFFKYNNNHTCELITADFPSSRLKFI